MTRPTWYRVRFGDASVAVRVEHPPAASLVEHVFGGARVRDPGAVAVTLRIAPGEQAGHAVLSRGRQHLYVGDCDGALALALLDQTVRALVQASRGGLVLHSGAVARDGEAVLLPGDSGVGKTTLTAWLLGRGFDYLTDELVFLRDHSLLCEAFRRALNVKQEDGRALDGILEIDDPARALKTPQGYLVAVPRTLRRNRPARVHAIIFPRFHKGAAFALQPLSPAECGLRLMSSLVNTRLRHDRGFSAVAHLARACPAYALSYGHLGQLDRNLAELEAAAGWNRPKARRTAAGGEGR